MKQEDPQIKGYLNSRIYLLFSLFLIINACSNSKMELRNKYLNVIFQDNHLSIYCAFNDSLKIPDVTLAGKVLSCEKKMVKDTLWGVGEQLKVTHGQRRVTTLSVFRDNPFVQIHTTIKNDNAVTYEVSKLDIASLELAIGQQFNGLNTLGTGGLKPIHEAEGSYTYSVLANPNSRNSIVVGWLTQLQGVGLMEPELKNNQDKQSYIVKTSLDFGRYTVKTGEERETDILVVGFFNDGREGLELYGDQLGKVYDIDLPEKPEVYCTWYHRDLSGSGASTEKALTANAAFAGKHLSPFGLNVMQIDDHWQCSMIDGIDFKTRKSKSGRKLGPGPIKTFIKGNGNFPGGMEAMATTLQKNGFVPGIWFMPFSGDVYHDYFKKDIFSKQQDSDAVYDSETWSGTPIDASSPAGAAFLRNRFERIYNWGYRYFKVDGLHTGAPSRNIYINRAYKGKPIFGRARIYDEDLTFVQCFRKGLSILREVAPKAFILGCSATQNMSSFGPSFGLVDAMRVGPDNDSARKGEWKRVVMGADYSGNLYFLNNRVWYNDPDPYYVRSTNPMNKARWMVSWQAISGVMGTSSMQYDNLAEERLDLLKRALPTHHLNARPIDILENKNPRIWMVNNDRMSVVGLFNWKEKEKTIIDYSFEKLGLEPDESYEMFDFWDNKYLGRVKQTLKTVLLPASCQVISVKKYRPFPNVISTSRHITQGFMDVVSENWNPKTNMLQGSSRVVANDEYELRVLVPENAILKSAIINGHEMRIVCEGNLLRASFIPNRSGEVFWQLEFEI